ncbi:MAG TPA: patatin-like protein [Acidimicrobiia bacterium]
MADADATRAEPPLDVCELRLALVCYGGVSLAVYMHGVTKELQKLVVASTAFERDVSSNPFDEDDSAHAYWDLLARLTSGGVREAIRQRGLTLRVVVDVISGTSAGGINGVCLAKALAGNHSQDALRDLWFERGDIKQLVRGWRWLPVPIRVAGLALPNPLKMKAPLRGDQMCRWLFDAFESMGGTVGLPGVRSLVPPDHEIQLFVPITDYHGYERDIPLYDPRFVRDRTHRHVMEFRHREPGGGTLGPEFHHSLAFAARATSSFPGAFAPIGFGDYARALGGEVDLSDLGSTFFPDHALSEAPPERTQFIDGGVLDNFPFQPAIAAIAAKPAATEVDRRLIFVEPDPGEGSLGPSGGDPPGLWRTVFAGYASIPRREPILDDLLRLHARNDVVLRIRDVIEANFASISDKVTAILTDELAAIPDDPTADELVALRRRVEDRAFVDAGFGAGAYLRLRVRSAIEGFASAIADVLWFPPRSHQRALVMAVLRRWAVGAGLLDQNPDPRRRQAQRGFLDALDTAFHERRIRFLIAAMSWWYRDAGNPRFPGRDELDAAKRHLYELVFTLRAVVPDLAAEIPLAGAIRDVFSADEIAGVRGDDDLALDEFLARHQERLDTVRERATPIVTTALSDLEARLHAVLVDRARGWQPEVRGALITRYLGFPFWDQLVYPLQDLSGVGERDHVEVYRMSPQDVAVLGSSSAGARAEWRREKLAGMALFHFGAFFDRPGRERDYLWGRLDAAERLVKLLLDVRREPPPITAPGAAEPPEMPAAGLAAQCKPVFESILADERSGLPHAADLLARVDEMVAGLPSLA